MKTVFDSSNIPIQFEDISSQITKNRSGDTMTINAYRLGNLIIGNLRLAVNSDLAPNIVFAKGFPKPDSNGTDVNVVALTISVYNNKDAKWGFIRSTTGEALMSGASATITSGQTMFVSFCYIARGDE